MGLLDRMRGSPGVHPDHTTRTRISESIDVTVPPEHAAAVQQKLQDWAQAKGWAAAVTAEGAGEDVKLSLKHDETLPGAPPDLEPKKLASELQKLVSDALNERT